MWFKDKIEIGQYIDFHKVYSDGADYTVRLDANDSALWCSTSIAQGSDRELKETKAKPGFSFNLSISFCCS